MNEGELHVYICICSEHDPISTSYHFHDIKYIQYMATYLQQLLVDLKMENPNI